MQKHDAGITGCFIGARFAQNGKQIPTFTASIRLLRDRPGYEQRKEMEAPLGGSHASARRGGGPRAWPGPVGPLRVGPGERKPGGWGTGPRPIVSPGREQVALFLLLLFFYLFHFPNPFSKRVLGKTIKDITETAIHKNTMLHHECKTCF